jgi:flagella basal body P-ring formation protein FlgA
MKGLFVKSKVFLAGACLAFILLVFSAGHASPPMKALVQIPRKCEVGSDIIRLGDIAKISCAYGNMLEKLRGLEIGRAPLPEKRNKFDVGFLEIRLKQNGIDPSEVKIDMPEYVEVFRSHIEVSEEFIKKAVISFVLENMPWERSMVKIGEVNVNQEVILPEGKTTYKVIPTSHEDYLGKTPMAVTFDVNGELQKKVWTDINIQVFDDVVVTKRPLGRYQIVSEQDVCIQRMELSGLSLKSIRDIDEAVGKRTRRRIDNNTVLTNDFIEFPPVVERGDKVFIIAESGPLRITARGEVKEKGHKGEIIKVINLDSKRTVYASVRDSNTVMVEF